MSSFTPSAFERASTVDRSTLLGEFVQFLRQNRKFWMIPVLLVMMAIGVLIVLGSTAAAPFIYTLF